MEAAEKSIASTLGKEEKALLTLTAKNARRWQIDRLSADIARHKTMLSLIRGEAMEPEALSDTLSAIPGYIAKIEKILPKFQPGTSQHTLAIRRIAAYRLCQSLAPSEEAQAELGGKK